jgi:probable rRNA maturation factor
MSSAIAAAPAIILDVMIESPLWDEQPDSETIVRAAIAMAAKDTAKATAEVAILLTDDSAIREMNRQWRDQDKPTNVLSFPSHAANAKPAHLGDIVIAYETLVRESKADDKPFAHHLTHLAIHGYLHLLGYDHMNDAEAETMERLEAELLERLGVPDPYTHSEPRA